jgi:hypothetical protein
MQAWVLRHITLHQSFTRIISNTTCMHILAHLRQYPDAAESNAATDFSLNLIANIDCYQFADLPYNQCLLPAS